MHGTERVKKYFEFKIDDGIMIVIIYMINCTVDRIFESYVGSRRNLVKC